MDPLKTYFILNLLYIELCKSTWDDEIWYFNETIGYIIVRAYIECYFLYPGVEIG